MYLNKFDAYGGLVTDFVTDTQSYEIFETSNSLEYSTYFSVCGSRTHRPVTIVIDLKQEVHFLVSYINRYLNIERKYQSPRK